MSTEFKDGYSRGFNEGGSGRGLDAYEISRHSDQYRVGYVLGFGESEFVSVPPDFRYRMMGDMASKSGVGISLFERHHDLSDGAWEDFKKGYQGDEDEELFDDEDFDD